MTVSWAAAVLFAVGHQLPSIVALEDDIPLGGWYHGPGWTRTAVVLEPITQDCVRAPRGTGSWSILTHLGEVGFSNMSDTLRPNILYIMTDQHRYDTFGFAGQTICRTPNLDRLASEGVRFDNAYTVCALCSPARSSMLTGLYPRNHRMWNNNDMHQWAVRDLPDDVRLISEDLRDAGYNCGYVGKWHCGETKVPSDYGFEGMDVPNYGRPYETPEYAQYLADHGLERPGRVPGKVEGSYEILTGPVEASAPAFLAQYCIDLMSRLNEEREATGKPFMVFLSFWGPHNPYILPEPYASMYDPDDIELWANHEDPLTDKPRVQSRRARRNAATSEETWRALIAQHLGSCSLIDAQIGRVLDSLREMGREQDTAVLFSSDHGNMVGSHGGLHDKGPWMYEEAYHVALMARVPWLDGGGAVCDSFCSNMDLASTVLDLAGLPVPECHDGRSLLPLVSDPQAEWPDSVISEYHGHRFLYSQRMLRWSHYKYVFNAPDYDELYDLERDPHELTNLIDSPEHADVVEEGRQRLVKKMEETQDPLSHIVNLPGFLRP